jgi:hypothetical protein
MSFLICRLGKCFGSCDQARICQDYAHNGAGGGSGTCPPPQSETCCTRVMSNRSATLQVRSVLS